MATIVIIEDDQDIRELVLYTLKSNGLFGLGFESGQDFFDANLKADDVDCFLLDVMLPGDDGLEILRKLRKDNDYKDHPIIMLTAKDSEMDKVKALDLGADDYVVKPFGVLELMSRIQARLRRTKKVNELEFYGITLNIDKHEVRVDNKKIELTNKEFDLLEYLMRNPNRVLSREALLETVWGYDFEGESRTLDIHVSTLRKNLESSSKYLQTVRGLGYKLGDLDD